MFVRIWYSGNICYPYFGDPSSEGRTPKMVIGHTKHTAIIQPNWVWRISDQSTETVNPARFTYILLPHTHLTRVSWTIYMLLYLPIVQQTPFTAFVIHCWPTKNLAKASIKASVRRKEYSLWFAMSFWSFTLSVSLFLVKTLPLLLLMLFYGQAIFRRWNI